MCHVRVQSVQSVFCNQNNFMLCFQDSDDYRSLMQQYKLILQQQENLQQENRILMEHLEKLRRESLAMTTQRESATVTIKYELESQKKEVLRLIQIIESLRLELENKQKENMKVWYTLFACNYTK